jgi:hypothetical protein
MSRVVLGDFERFSHQISIYEAIMDLDIQLETEVLRAFEKECRKSRGRYWFYPYLSAVVTLVDDLKRRGMLKQAGRKLRKKLKLRCDRRTDAIKAIVDATSRADRRTRSRWGQSIRYTLEYRDRWNPRAPFQKILKESGGVAGCAAKIATRRRKPKKGEWPKDWK